jgi:urea transporter
MFVTENCFKKVFNLFIFPDYHEKHKYFTQQWIIYIFFLLTAFHHVSLQLNVLSTQLVVINILMNSQPIIMFQLQSSITLYTRFRAVSM